MEILYMENNDYKDFKDFWKNEKYKICNMFILLGYAVLLMLILEYYN